MPPLLINSLCKRQKAILESYCFRFREKASFEVYIDATGKSYEEEGHSWVYILGASTIEVKTEDSYKSLACPDNIVCSRLV